ncbi:hypothetical protein Tco_1556389, partial [Tanacetum coccineum]
FLALGWHLEKIHVTWAHLEKKRTRLQTYTEGSRKGVQEVRATKNYETALDLHQILEDVLLTERGDGVSGIKRRRHDLFSDDVWNLETVYGYSNVGRFDVFFHDQLLVFQQHQDESLYDSWTRFKDVIRKVPNHGLSIWTLIEIFLKHLDSLSRHIINLTAEGDLRKFSDIGAWVQEYTPSVTYPDEVEEIIGIPIEVEPLDETPLEDLGLNTVDLGEERDPEPPIKPPSEDSFRMKEVDHLTIHKPPSPHVASFHLKDTYCYYHLCIDDPKKHYGFKPGLLGQSGSLGVDFSNMEMINDDWELEPKEVSFLGRRLNLPIKPKEVENVGTKETHHLEHIIQQLIFQRVTPPHNNGVYRYLLVAFLVK